MTGTKAFSPGNDKDQGLLMGVGADMVGERSLELRRCRNVKLGHQRSRPVNAGVAVGDGGWHSSMNTVRGPLSSRPVGTGSGKGQKVSQKGSCFFLFFNPRYPHSYHLNPTIRQQHFSWPPVTCFFPLQFILPGAVKSNLP